MKGMLALAAVLILGLVYAPVARADEDSRRIYVSLSLFGRPVKGFGPETIEKSVGGLICQQLKTTAGSSAYFDYECELKKKNRDDQAIYQALGLAAVRDRRAKAGDIVDVKKVGNLECTSTISSDGTPKFLCDLD